MTEMMLHDDRDTIIAGLREQLRQVRQELSEERSKGGSVEAGVVALRKVLTPLYGALQHIFGETDAMGLEDSPRPSPGKTAVWDSWKGKLSGTSARAIDALLLHGTMTAEQLRIHLGCANRTCYNIIGELNKAKLINKNGGRISLKEL